MKRIAAVLASSLLFAIVFSTSITEQMSASIMEPAQAQVPSPVRQLPGLQSLTFFESTTGLGIRQFTFAAAASELNQRRPDPLSASNNDFQGSPAIGTNPAELYDVFYSDTDGTPNPEGRYVTIECQHACEVCTSLNIAQVNLNFAGGRVEFFNQVASFVTLGSGAQPASVANAVDGNPQTITVMGDTVGTTQRLRLTLGFLPSSECNYSILPASQTFPGFFPVGFESGTFRVTAPDNCEWEIDVDSPGSGFLSVALPSTVSGSRTIAFDVLSSNPASTPRTGRIHIVDVASGEIRQTFTVIQEGFNCPASGYSITPGNVVIDRGGGSFSFTATAPPGCQLGAPTIDVDWIRFVTSVDLGGRSTYFFDVRPNPGNFRTGTIDVSGQKFYVYQNPQGCPIELICAFFPGACGIPEEFPEGTSSTSMLESSRKFRDVKLASTSRGQNYTTLYYTFATEAVQVMMFNPMLMLRSREVLERYTPVVEAMSRNERVILSDGDLDEIDGFISSFAEKSGVEMRETIELLRRDLRDPQVHREFNITVRPGQKREVSKTYLIQMINEIGGVFTFFAVGAAFVFSFIRRGGRNLRIRCLLCVTLALSIVQPYGRFSELSSIRDRVEASRTRLTSGLSIDRRSPVGLSKGRLELPLSFEVNQGQADSSVKFLSRASDYDLYLTATEATIKLRNARKAGIVDQRMSSDSPSTNSLPGSTAQLRMKLRGSNPDARVRGLGPPTAPTNYFIGNDPKKWRSNVPSYEKVKCENVYSGVDLIYYGNRQELEYDFNVAPGADFRAIRLEVENADQIELDDRGDLVLSLSGGEVRHRKPFAYQEVDGVRHPVACDYTILETRSQPLAEEQKAGAVLGFEVGAYDAARPLVIDPVLSYSTYLGGSGNEEGNAIAVDNAGNTYIVGFTDSLDFPTASATQPVFGGGRQDAFVVKLDPSGTRVIYSTYLGGDQQDNATSIAVDETGNPWLTGFTASTNFPVVNAFQPNRAGLLNAFVSRLNAGGSLIYSTHLGGNGSDYGSSVAVDASGNVYVSGMTTSVNFPLANATQSSFGGVVDMYVAKFNASGRRLLYSTFLGGAGIDGASSIAVDSSGSIYVTGLTSSPNLRIVNALQPQFGGGLFDAFVAKLNASGSQLIYSTYLGGSREDRGLRVAIDSEGNAYVTGDTDSFNFTTTAGALQANAGGGADAFVAKLNSSGTQLIYSTYLGGSGIEGGTAIAVDASGSAVVTGFTGSTNFPTSSALQQTFGGGSFDGFVAKIGARGTHLDYSSYLGGTDVDSGFGAAVDAAGSLFIMGLTKSIDFPTAGALQRNNAGGASDLFVAKIKPGPVISDVRIGGKNLFVTGGVFDQGAVILLNGEQQKTAFQSSTELKGKKVAKKILPGQAVRLQVRNADGLTSLEFNFTRP